MATTFVAVQPDSAEQGVRIDKEKYDAMRNAILEVLKMCGPMSFMELSVAVDNRLKGIFEGSVLWYFTTVKLDLEASGEIRRIPKSRPQMIEIVQETVS